MPSEKAEFQLLCLHVPCSCLRPHGQDPLNPQTNSKQASLDIGTTSFTANAAPSGDKFGGSLGEEGFGHTCTGA